ncbi:hypothetical protein ANO11243_064270 [Dothideomycetidae sp. 11243]|nr:hypothetical protein ANO11243_064270 [fungal sp. No.11243]
MCNSERSIFATDPKTHLSWFRPGSLEPLYRYELFGILFGLAAFNGITLPVSFPLAFYTKLMGLPISPSLLDLDWPDVSKGFRQLLDYDGDVETDWAMDHNFVIETNGLYLSLDMMHYEWTDEFEAKAVVHDVRHDKSLITKPDATQFSWPAPVTKENRLAYTHRYTEWMLDYSIRPQFYAFAKGFYRVVDLRATRLLSPANFKRLVEGHSNVTAAQLQQHVTYEGGYSSDSPHIQWFWEILQQYSEEKLRKLLEFVTASKRVPASGSAGLRFVIIALDDENGALPCSATCFGHLNLPRYESKEIMTEKLDIALEHSIGFGQA